MNTAWMNSPPTIYKPARPPKPKKSLEQRRAENYPKRREKRIETLAREISRLSGLVDQYKQEREALLKD